MSDTEKNIPEGWEVRKSRSTGKQYMSFIQYFTGECYRQRT